MLVATWALFSWLLIIISDRNDGRDYEKKTQVDVRWQQSIMHHQPDRNHLGLSRRPVGKQRRIKAASDASTALREARSARKPFPAFWTFHIFRANMSSVRKKKARKWSPHSCTKPQSVLECFFFFTLNRFEDVTAFSILEVWQLLSRWCHHFEVTHTHTHTHTLTVAPVFTPTPTAEFRSPILRDPTCKCCTRVPGYLQYKTSVESNRKFLVIYIR